MDWFMDSLSFLVGLGVIFFAILWFVYAFFVQSGEETFMPREIEEQHLIRDKWDGIELAVNTRQLNNAVKTGDYEIVQMLYGGDLLKNNQHVPAGYRLKKDNRLEDERLNR